MGEWLIRCVQVKIVRVSQCFGAQVRTLLLTVFAPFLRVFDASGAFVEGSSGGADNKGTPVSSLKYGAGPHKVACPSS